MRVIVALSLFVIALSLASAEIEFNVTSENLQAGETLFAKISGVGNNSKLLDSSVSFLEGRKKVFFEYDSILVNDSHYIYAYTTREGNFTLKIENFLYDDNGVIASKDFSEDFEVKNVVLNETNVTGTKILSIRPGFLTMGEELTLENKGSLDLNVEVGGNKTLIKSGGKTSLKSLNGEENYFLGIKTYKDFDVLVVKIRDLENFTNFSVPAYNLRPVVSYFIRKVNSNVRENISFEFENTGTKPLEIYNVSSDIEYLDFESSLEIGPKSKEVIGGEIFADGRGILNGSVTFEYVSDGKRGSLVVPAELYVLEKGENKSNLREELTKTCSEIEGTLCEKGLICNGEQVITSEKKYCCLAKCVEVKGSEKKSSNVWIYGVLIIVVLGIVGYLMYKKQKGVGKKAEDKFDSATKSYTGN